MVFELTHLQENVAEVYFYRGEGKPEPLTEKCAHVAMVMSWTWLFYQFINNGYTMLGEDVFPDSSTFTDSELGIE
ncbi:hypothetical protein CRM22_004556 [Opisthorchis felineus]|uniref:Uncharacterized protein n=1 Tax=Opisthorchis felineus TaxID=147828 RepID=A0A4S2M0Y7_OPIFE|nr:hypothetical protein CRM22_004556 [Opisthorchis felineus]